jgi:uncharacterized protein YllA (UPF0747 family)
LDLRLLSYPDLFIDFVQDFATVGHIFTHPPIRASLAKVRREAENRSYSREPLADLLLEQADYFASGSSTRANIRSLRNRAVPVVLTNLRPHALGGPLSDLLKALTAARLAADLTERGIAAVPLIWLDHWGGGHGFSDSIGALNSNNKLTDLRLPFPVDTGPSPGSLESLREVLTENLGGAALQGEPFRFFEACFRNSETMVQAWGRWLSGILADRGIVLLDPDWGGMGKLVESSRIGFEWKSRRAGTCESGQSSPASDGGDPSPLQSLMMPVIASVIDPEEIHPRSLSEPWYRRLQLPTPVWWPAASVTITDSKSRRILSRHDLSLADCFGGTPKVLERLLPAHAEVAVRGGLENAEELITKALSGLRRPVPAGDRDSFAESGKRMRHQIAQLLEKYFRARRRRRGELERQFEYACNLLAPEGRRQEKVLGWFYFLLHRGRDFPEFLYHHIETGNFTHQLLTWG